MGQINARQASRNRSAPSNIIKDVDLDDRRRLLRRLRRAVRLRQVDAAAPDRRARGRHRRQILIDGTNVVDVPPAKRGLSMVFQSYALYPHMSVRGNIGFGLKMAGLPKEEIRPQGRGGGRDAQPDALSRPQAARALRRPAPARRDRPRDRARAEGLPVRRAARPTSMRRSACRCGWRSPSCRSSSRTTAIYVTHDQVEAMTMADKIVVLNAGRIEQVGSPLELYDRPANLFVAGFIGSPKMNLVPGESGRREPRWRGDDRRRGRSTHEHDRRRQGLAWNGEPSSRSPSISAATPSSTSTPTASATLTVALHRRVRPEAGRPASGCRPIRPGFHRFDRRSAGALIRP